MSVEDKDGGEESAKLAKKQWKKPVTINFAIRDHTEDGYLTGSDNGDPFSVTREHS